GHPEYGYAPGVETTTGPLGQGLANAVGMALAERVLGAQFNQPKHSVVDHFTYCFLGDGCMMEGISHEVASLAGTLGLGKLVAFYDDNGISIDGDVDGWFTDDTVARFEAYGWQVIPRVDGHDQDEIKTAIDTARKNTSQPTLICCKTIIGFGSPNKEGKEESHGAPLGADEIKLTRERLGWQYDSFEIPEHIYEAWDARGPGRKKEQAWNDTFAAYEKAHPELAKELKRRMAGDLPANFSALADAKIAEINAKAETIASRKASQNAIDAFASLLPEFLGGSADLAGSNLTKWSGFKAVTRHDANGNYMYYGVREFGMTAVMSGVALHGGFIPFGGTFLMFMEYARNAVRMAALMKQRNILVYTHDSIGLGEDGPTHQPVEQLTALRVTPNLETWRPCDSVESAVSWKCAIERQDGPSALIFSRQGLPHQNRDEATLAAVAQGGYILQDSAGTPEVILIATGSEVQLAVAAAADLNASGLATRVVSMPCAERFMAQVPAYRESVLPSDVRRRVAVEAASKDYWYKFVGLDGAVVGMDSFGESAPAGDLYQHFGITKEAIVSAAQATQA
ncbi:MAG: transketolase, partial [Natronospirillum sp.]